MKNRRNFIKMSAATIASAPFITSAEIRVTNVSNHTPVIKQAEDCEVYFVRPNTPITFHITKDADNISSVSLLSEELLPGSKIPTHKHLHEDEYFFFLSGTGTVTVEDASFSFKPGTTAFIPRDTFHSIENTGTEKAIFHFGYSPAGFEGFFSEAGTPKGQEFTPKPKEEFNALAKKYGMVFKNE